jgi:predicted Zn-dependent peptidase
MYEIHKEMSDIQGPRRATAEELAFAKNTRTLTLPGSWETNVEVAGSITDIVRYGLPDEHFETYPTEVRALTSGWWWVTAPRSRPASVSSASGRSTRSMGTAT